MKHENKGGNNEEKKNCMKTKNREEKKVMNKERECKKATLGIEPRTFCLRDRRNTIKLRRQITFSFFKEKMM